MTPSRLLGAPAEINHLAERLNHLKSVSRFDLPGEPQGGTIAHALSDLEESFSQILETLLPKLLSETASREQLDETLLGIGEELRHVLYHLKDTKFFGYLLEG